MKILQLTLWWFMTLDKIKVTLWRWAQITSWANPHFFFSNWFICSSSSSRASPTIPRMPFNNPQIKRCDLAAFQLRILNVDGEKRYQQQSESLQWGKKKKGESTLIQTPTCIHAAVHYGICPAPVAVGTFVSLSPQRLIFPPSASWANKEILQKNLIF